MSFRQALTLCETALKQTALTQCQLMILSFRWRRRGAKRGRVAALLKHKRFWEPWPSALLKEARKRGAVRKTVTVGWRVCATGCCIARACWFHVLGTCREHMLSWSPWADIEDEERRYFKGSVFPEVGLPQRIRLGLLTSLPWTSECWDLHTNGRGS